MSTLPPGVPVHGVGGSWRLFIQAPIGAKVGGHTYRRVRTPVDVGVKSRIRFPLEDALKRGAW